MRTRSLSRSLLGLCLLSFVGCDAPMGTPEQGPVPDAAARPTPAPAAPATAGGNTAAADTVTAARLVRDYGTCYAGCFDTKTSATNRETCKLTCEGAAEASAEVLAAPAKNTALKTVATLHGCIDQCLEDGSLNATNRETCILTCSDTAELAVAAPPAPAPAPAS